ncbi:unnamed protein product [Caenorhabditis angaria]|uniref:Protein kinase domain-containing protein n=1 Tax=Caenorhabditis angaria TaxID=860376 RepID=A0A9P1N888_9PELO|nr:unnamed protein product [Caenorhabditis angaria]
MKILLLFLFLPFLGKTEKCDCYSDCLIKSSMALRGPIKQVHEGNSSKLFVTAVVYVEGIEFEEGRYDLLKNDTSLAIDWLPMSHDVIETSRRPPNLRNIHFVDVGQETTAIIIELNFDILNMKLRSTYEIRVNSIYDRQCDRMIEMSSYAAMNVTFACERIVDSDCRGSIKVDHHPVCSFMRSYHTSVFENKKLDTVELDVLISINKNDQRFEKLKYFVAFFGICDIEDVTNNGECILDLHKSEAARFCVPNRLNCSHTRSFSLTIRPYRSDVRYGVQICGVLDRRFESPPIISSKSKSVADMLSVSATSSAVISNTDTSLLKTLFGYAVVLALLLIVLILFITCKCLTGRWCKEYENNCDDFIIDEDSLTIFEDRIIGKGRFGTVFLGQLSPDWHGPVVLDECQRVAVKTNRYLDKSKKRFFIDEIEGAKVISRHSRLLSSIGTVFKNGNILHIQEYCANGNLLEYLILKRRYMTELQERGIDLNGSLTSIVEVDFDEVISFHDLYRIASQICSGMVYLSSKLIVHNALCAKHILITQDHNVKIGDFGFISTSTTPNNSPVEGQQKWTSLELLRGETSTQLSDVWSFGVTIWEIFTMGGRPYYNVPDAGIRGLVEKGFRLQKPDGCSIQLYQLMRETWLDSPSDRPCFNVISTRIANLAQQSSPETNNFMTISTLCDYYLDDAATLSSRRGTIQELGQTQTHYDPAALISESERLLGFRM